MNDDASVRDELVLKLNTLLGGTPAILPGCEFFWAADTLELLEQRDSPITLLNRSQYLLVEFTPGIPPRGIDEALHELGLQGVVIVIAHPERNPLFARDPDRLARLVGDGAITQVTAGSFLGDFGRQARDAAIGLMQRGLVHVIASDAHSLSRRPPRMAEAREHVLRTWGAEAADGLFVSNPEAIAASLPLSWLPS